ncbi:MAG: hypothetical protein M3394_02595 [Actinomycetota bacterium]|nr:hypothetical protein [Actinomycetota bacterium]
MRVLRRHVPAVQFRLRRPHLEEPAVAVEKHRGVEVERLDDELELGSVGVPAKQPLGLAAFPFSQVVHEAASEGGRKRRPRREPVAQRSAL